MNEFEARLALFANIEGGHTFWSNQITELGALVEAGIRSDQI